MKDKTFEINWRGTERNVDFTECFGVNAGACINVNDHMADVNLVIGNIVNKLYLEPKVLDILISDLSRIRGEINELREIRNNVYKELDNICSFAKKDKALIFFVSYSPNQSNFRLKVLNPIDNKCLMDRAINVDKERIDVLLLTGNRNINKVFAHIISENLIDYDKDDLIFSYVFRNLIVDVSAYKDTKRGQRKNANLIVDEESKYHNPSEIALNKVYKFILFAISPDEESKGLKKIKSDLLFHFYMVNNDNKKIPCVKIKIAGSERTLFNEEIKDFDLLLHTISENRNTKNVLSDILTRNICSLSCRITDIPNDPKTFNTPKSIIEIEKKFIDKYEHASSIWSLVKQYIFNNMIYTKDYLEVYKLSKEDK